MQINGIEISRSRIMVSSALIIGVVLLLVLYLLFRGDADGDGDNADSFFGALLGGEERHSGGSPLEGGIIIREEETKKEGMMLYQISADPVVGAALSPNGLQVRYFKHTSGHLYENEFTGEKELRISNITIPAILDVEWTRSKSYAIISYYADGELRRLYSRYSGTSTIASAFLPNTIQEITASETDDAIAYTITTGEKTTLYTARPDNTGVKNIISLPTPDFELSWPTANTISLKQKSSAYAPSFLFTLNLSSKLLTRVLAEKEGLDTLWSPDGNRFLAMETHNEGTQISVRVVSLKDNKAIVLPFVTLPEKCAWAPAEKDVLLCAIPETIPRGANLPDEWWQGSISFNDGIWRINITTGEQQQLLPAYQLDAINIFLSKDESFLFFTNKKDGTLWSLSLKHES